jgi:hypothetical protein
LHEVHGQGVEPTVAAHSTIASAAMSSGIEPFHMLVKELLPGASGRQGTGVTGGPTMAADVVATLSLVGLSPHPKARMQQNRANSRKRFMACFISHRPPKRIETRLELRLNPPMAGGNRPPRVQGC